MSGFTANRPAEHRQTILMCCDDNYFPFATLLAQQISDAFPERQFDICILYSGDFPQHPIIETLGLRLLEIEIPESWQGLATSKKITLAAYLRIIAPRLLADEYDRILYLDSDMIYQRGDIEKLIALDIGDHAVAAVRDNYQHRAPNRIAAEFKANNKSVAPYFNSGVLLIDVPKFIGLGIEEKSFEWTKNREKGPRVKHDQRALNLALHGDWAELSPVWNWPCFHRYFFLTHFIDPCFIHFLSSRKPWRDVNGIYSATHVRIIHDHLAKHFPEAAKAMPERPKPGTEFGKWLWIFVRHALDYRRIAPYLNRFSGDFDVKTK
ncbi:General stress protein A [Aliiroseovarius sp. xm-m-379]|uniref:glycosyltransferase family 8 protein n=1 Tax=unclassified Aliiroseovarius TaxID=2623558 RepID=UPI0015686007|nr:MULTISPECIES: glycosyltransferase family 8 protein [unclassified Aliiroseovarius]NRP13261.1 General stress protein A [Aliiroseovarius sp. xm-d-517]NRP25916.1 General stress protein A [Aliiroseovarius sp. xm-m-379]NRP30283.1 General stress protein A [Aliiroseovarius sp. xm-m-314]NRP34715.1 General stress protein A [Aliiroseovarius sp. xm-a-104]NRP40264.1 General stress protein A [Aliiroseovarius sp. xm-m-339-2]